MRGWSQASILSSNFHLHGRLSREVSLRSLAWRTPLTYAYRIIVATIRNLGLSPCPRCLVKKEDICKLGTDQDSRARERLRRIDDDARNRKVDTARGLIYDSHKAVDSVPVDRILKEDSLVPTQVCSTAVLSDLMIALTYL